MKQLFLPGGGRVAIHFSGNDILQDSIPLVLLHGFSEDSSMWEILVPHLKDIPMLAIDLPGFGQSDLPAAPNIERYAQAVIGTLDALQVQRFVLVGHSLGGYVALEIAAHWGDRLAGLGLFHSHPFADDEALKAARMRSVDMLRSGKRDLIVSQLFPRLFSASFASKHPDVLNAMIEQGKKQSAEGLAYGHLAMMSRADHQETLKKVSFPVLFLLGTADDLVPLEKAWQTALLPNISSIEVMEGVAHMGMFEATSQSATVIQSFYGMARLFS